MNHISVQQIAILLMIVLLVVAMRRLSRLGVRSDDLSRVLRELKRHVPVYSAETVQGQEAKFIRERLPKQLPTLLVLLAALVLGALAWWLTR